MKMITAILLASSIATIAIAQPATPKGPTEYKLTVSPDTVNWLGRALDELPAKIANPISQDLIRQINEQNTAYAKAHEPAPAEPPKPEK